MSIFIHWETAPQVTYLIPPVGNGPYESGMMTLAIAKVGGGRIGASHKGMWLVAIVHEDEVIYETAFNGLSFYTHASVTHAFMEETESECLPWARRIYIFVENNLDLSATEPDEEEEEEEEVHYPRHWRYVILELAPVPDDSREARATVEELVYYMAEEVLDTNYYVPPKGERIGSLWKVRGVEAWNWER